MTLNATQFQIRSYIDGLEVPYYPNPLQTWIAPPVPGNVGPGKPGCFIWGAAGHEVRSSIPRSQPGLLSDLGLPANAAWKEANHSVSLLIVATVQIRDPNRDQKFPVLIEAVKKAMRLASMPQRIIDPTTQEISWLLDLGENMSWEYDIDRTLNDQRSLRNLCRLDVSVKEMFQA